MFLSVALLLLLGLTGTGVWAWARWQTGPGTSALALLPIHADPRDRELALVALSIDDLLAHRLGAVPGLEVRTPAGDLGPGLPSRESPRALGGRLHRSGATGRVRLEVELIERVESGGQGDLGDRSPGNGGVRRTVLGRFDVPFVDGSADLAVFVRVRDTVARRVLARVLSAIGPAIDLAPEPGLAPRDAEAYRLYLLALLDLREAGCVGDAAIGLLERSLERDPGFAPAWEELGWARYNLVSSCGESGENYALAAAAAGRALALAPGWARAAALEAVVLTETGRPEQAWRRLAAARRRAPSNLDLRFAEAYVLTYAGLLDQAAARIEQVAAADPTYLAVEGWTPNALLHRGRPGDPERFLELLPGAESPLFLFYRGYAEAQRGREAKARAVLAPVFRRQPGDLFARLAQAQLAILEGDRGQALLHLRQLALQRHAVGGSDGEVTYKLAQLLALAGSPDEAFGQLRLALAQGFFCPACLRKRPGLGRAARRAPLPRPGARRPHPAGGVPRKRRPIRNRHPADCSPGERALRRSDRGRSGRSPGPAHSPRNPRESLLTWNPLRTYNGARPWAAGRRGAGGRPGREPIPWRSLSCTFPFTAAPAGVSSPPYSSPRAFSRARFRRSLSTRTRGSTRGSTTRP